VTLSGRRIELEKSDARFERWVRNLPVQGSGADMLKLALGYMVSPLNALDAHIVLILHDEVIVETPTEVVDDVVEIVRSSMIRAGEQLISVVPTKVNIKVSEFWS